MGAVFIVCYAAEFYKARFFIKIRNALLCVQDNACSAFFFYVFFCFAEQE